MVDKALFSSATGEWETPQWLFDELDKEFGFTLDVCASPDNHKCGRYLSYKEDGLQQSWDNEVCWMNPPYGRQIGKWVERAHNEAWDGNAIVVCLLPVRPDTKWWQYYILHNRDMSLPFVTQSSWPQVRFVRGRLKFGNAKNSAPFPSAVVVFRKRI
jgi:site-specific DNA-methyltransferase (adenine-specific)